MGRRRRGLLPGQRAAGSRKKVLERHFASQRITEDNLSRWRQGGYAGWLEQRATPGGGGLRYRQGLRGR